jgi:hypothetical protein
VPTAPAVPAPTPPAAAPTLPPAPATATPPAPAATSPTAPAAPAATAPTAPASSAAPSTAPAQRAAPAPVGRETGTPAAPLVPGQRPGTPDGRDDIFRPRDATPGAAPAEAPRPRLDLDQIRQRAREIATERTGSPGILSVVPIPPDRRSRLAEEIEKAVKPDCRTAYANLGLLAVPALVAGAVADAGCRW